MFRNSSRNKTLPCVAGYVQHSPREGQVVSRVGVVGPRPGAVTPRAGVVGGPRPGAVTPTAGVVGPRPGALTPTASVVGPRPPTASVVGPRPPTASVVGPRPRAVTPTASVVGPRPPTASVVGPRGDAVTPTAGVVEPMPAAVVPFRALGTAAAAASVVPVVGLASGNRARDTTTAAHLENFRSQRRELLSHREAASSIVTPAADETPGRVTARRRRCRGCGQ